MAQSSLAAHHQASPAYQSPSQSLHAQAANISVETLVSYLVASKRSLGSINLVHRATTILTDARASVESTTALLAKCTYLRRSLASQLKILRGVQFELEAATQAIQLEFQAVIKELDETDTRLLRCITRLKETEVDAAFRPARGHEVAATLAHEDPGKRTLYDFVDDKGVETIKDAMKTAIDNIQDAQREMNQTIQTLEEDLQSINEVLNDRIDASGTESELQPPRIGVMLALLENQAREMAEGLESLVKHFDLCVAAIKHTEGGGAAVIQTMDVEDLPEGVGMGMEELSAPVQPMNDDERVEMLHILQNDAAEVDEVVLEIQERDAEMELQLDRILLWRDRSENAHSDVMTAFKLIEKVGSRLSNYVAETARHTTRWSEEKAKIEDGIGGMEELTEHYANFLHSYDALIVETARRRTVKKQMERIVNEAHAQLEQLYEQDKALRLDFKNDRGEFLPSDIWHGVHQLPPRYAIERVDEDGMSEASSVPDLPRHVVEEALRRLKGRIIR